MCSHPKIIKEEWIEMEISIVIVVIKSKMEQVHEARKDVVGHVDIRESLL